MGLLFFGFIKKKASEQGMLKGKWQHKRNATQFFENPFILKKMSQNQVQSSYIYIFKNT